MSDPLSRMRGGLVVSCQPVTGGLLEYPEIVAAMAAAAIARGAAGIRIEGVEYLRATRAATTAPIIGLMKRDLADSPVRITPFVEDVQALATAGADIVAGDATARPRQVALADLAGAIRAADLIGMADGASAWPPARVRAGRGPS